MGLVLKYVQEPKPDRQGFRYRRRVPDSLKQIMGKGELVAPLGRTKEEALRSYPSVHQRFEKMLAAAKRKVGRSSLDVQTKLQQFWEVVEELRDLGVDDPLNTAKYPDTADLRDAIIDEVLFRSPEDPETGDPILENPKDALKLEILAGRASPPPASIDDAMKLYVAEKLGGNDFEYRKALRRVERIVGEVKVALDPAPSLDEFSRDHARKVRDHLIRKGLKASSVTRELATLAYLRKLGIPFTHQKWAWEASFRTRVKELIEIRDIPSLSSPGNGLRLSHSGQTSREGKAERDRVISQAMRKLKERQLATVPLSEVIITCAKENWYKNGREDEGKPGGFAKDSRMFKAIWLPNTTRGTNDYAHASVAIYLYDQHLNPGIARWLGMTGCLADDRYALSELIQWVFRSRVRKGQPIVLYVPSKRMRMLLVNWLETGEICRDEQSHLVAA